jgi:dTDP-4-amino-4,6-dideoxygalactose transaminase
MVHRKRSSREQRDTPHIPFFRPFTDNKEVIQAKESIRSGWLTTGPKVAKFEKEIRSLVGSTHAIAVNSCTAALHLSLIASGVGCGDEVVTSPYTFAATGEAILYLGARPVFADIDPETLNISPAAVARCMTRRTKVILPVHIAGLPCDMRAIGRIARQWAVPVVEDAAHALGASARGRSIGSISAATCFSFYATKNLTTGEGGMITTKRATLARRLRLLSLHGLSLDAWNRYKRGGSWRYDIERLGFKYNMTDVAAAIGLAQLSKFRDMQRRRWILARRYNSLLADLDVFDLPQENPDSEHAWHLYIVRLRQGVLRIGRDRVIDRLRAAGIGTSVHFIPLHLHSFYRRKFGYKRGSYPHAEREAERAISLPLYPGLSRRDQMRVADALRGIVARNRR